MSGAIRLLPPYAFRVWKGTASVYFYLLNQLLKIKGITHVCRWPHGKVTQGSPCSLFVLSDRPTSPHLSRFLFLSPTWHPPPPPHITRRRALVWKGVLQTRTLFCVYLFQTNLIIPVFGYDAASLCNPFLTSRKNTAFVVKGLRGPTICLFIIT
jgi:hypothetical protein